MTSPPNDGAPTTIPTLDWQVCGFDDLDKRTLTAIFALRQAVFVVEQDCPYLDIDGLDEQCFHLTAQHDGELLAYLRCVPPGVSWAASALGRIVVAPAARGTSTGRELVRRGLEFNRRQWPDIGIEIGAQSYLLKFYSELGFVAEGEEYDEDGIPHTHMVFTG